MVSELTDTKTRLLNLRRKFDVRYGRAEACALTAECMRDKAGNELP